MTDEKAKPTAQRLRAWAEALIAEGSDLGKSLLAYAEAWERDVSEIEQLKRKVIWGCYADKVPSYSHYPNICELHQEVSAEEINALVRETERLRERIARYETKHEFGGRDEAWNLAIRTLEALSMPSTYKGERTGGVLAGCPRTRPPTPEELAARVLIVLNRIRELANQPVDDGEWPPRGTPSADKTKENSQ